MQSKNTMQNKKSIQNSMHVVLYKVNLRLKAWEKLVQGMMTPVFRGCAADVFWQTVPFHAASANMLPE